MNSPVRKNFVFDAVIAQHLEELAKEQQISMTALLQNMIEVAYEKIERRKKIAIAKSLIDSANGLFSDEKSIQSIKEEQNV